MTNTNITKNQPARYEESTMLPPVDVIEDDSGITLYADLPGVSKDKLRVRVEADVLNIEGEVTLPFATHIEASHSEVYLPRYHRAFTLGQELDREKVGAEFKNGVLKLHVPKAEHAKARKIEIDVG